MAADLVPYGTGIQQAIASGDLAQMRKMSEAAESYLKEHGDLAALIQLLKIEIAKIEHKHS
jgi:hypothetical protein